jgi:hypothetical protein
MSQVSWSSPLALLFKVADLLAGVILPGGTPIFGICGWRENDILTLR